MSFKKKNLFVVANYIILYCLLHITSKCVKSERKIKHERASNNDLKIKKDTREKSFEVLINNNIMR